MTQNYEFTTEEEHPMHYFPITSFFANYNKTHKLRLNYEIKYDLYKVPQKITRKLSYCKNSRAMP